MRPIILSAALILAAVPALSQSKTDDPKALTVLTRMADNIGALHSCSFKVDVSHDEWDAEDGMMEKLHNSHEVFLVGPDKMLVNTTGDAGHRGFWYDGKDAYSYWYGENNYGRIAAPSTIIAMIQSIHEAYGVDFPAADLLYPTFVDDLPYMVPGIVLPQLLITALAGHNPTPMAFRAARQRASAAVSPSSSLRLFLPSWTFTM